MNLLLQPCTFLALLTLTACDGSDPSVVATAGEHEWTVEEAAALIAPNADLPARADVVRALADLWIDYTLLATAAADDSTMSHIDVSQLANQLVEERLILSLRDSVISVDSLAPGELRTLYDAEAPGSIVRPRQILLRWPVGATEQQRDSVRRAMDQLRGRIVNDGEEFAAVAAASSQDAGSAPRGGDLGPVARNQVANELGEALFALDEGEVSEPLESPIGVHLFLVESTETPTLEEFRVDLFNRRVSQAESVYVAGLEAEASPMVSGEAPQIVMRLARDPRAFLSDSERNEAVVRYQGGAVTQGEVQQYLQNQAPELRNRIAAAPPETLGMQALQGLLRRELLLMDVQRRGWSVRPEVQQGLVDAARSNLAGAARQMGLVPRGDDRQQAIDTAVSTLLSGMLSGAQREVTPLGPMGYVLRAQYEASFNEEALENVVRRVQEIRQAGGNAAPAD